MPRKNGYALLATMLQEEAIVVGGVTRTFRFADHPRAPPRDGVLIFLHGVDTAEVSDQTRGHYVLFHAAADRLNLVSVFPRGLPGALPEQPDLLGWYPKTAAENHAFLSAIIARRIGRRRPGHGRTVIAGFSNGAFFAAHELQQAHPLGDGYYLIAGGEPSGSTEPRSALPAAVIEVGRADRFQFGKAMALAELLGDCGSRPSRLRVIVHEGGHELLGLGLEENLRFLLKPPP